MSLISSEDQSLNFPSQLAQGTNLRLAFRASSDEVETEINCTILEVYPPTMSLVLHVAICGDSQRDMPSETIVKLYHRSFLINLRHSYDEKTPWGPDKERHYRRYLQDVARGICRPVDFSSRNYPWQWEDDPNRDYGEFEAYLQHRATASYDVERWTYERLQGLQGKTIPKLYGTVSYSMDHPFFDPYAYDHIPPTELIRGVILEYISPISFDNFIETWVERWPHLPTTILPLLCNQAIQIVDTVSDFDVLNRDVRPQNFLVRPSFLTDPLSPGSCKDTSVPDDGIVLIDFGMCRFRGQKESDEEWRKAKWSEDETGAIGVTSANLIRNTVGPGIYEYDRGRSMRWYKELSPDDPDYPSLLPGFTLFAAVDGSGPCKSA